jgi:hypothetical protein
VPLLLLVAGWLLWSLHARAWDLGGRSPILGYDTAQYAVAARTLAMHGRLATPFALPIELASHPSPPWPLAVVQPGLVIAEAALFRIAPPLVEAEGDGWRLRVSDHREWLTLLIPLLAYLALGVVLAALAARILSRAAPGLGRLERHLAAGVLGLAFLLDPEAQHFATGGFTELPFTLGVIAALGMLAGGRAARQPLLFGLLLGVAGSFRASMLWFAPLLALAAAWSAGRERAPRTVALVLAGYAVVLAPWWIYKWRAFGSPGWDLTRYVVWEGIEGRSWFSLFHLPEAPVVPSGLEAARLVAGKTAARLPDLLALLAAGPRALWIGAVVLWLVLAQPSRPLAAAAAALLGMLAASVVAASASIPWLRFLFPARVPLEAAGALALWGLIALAPVSLFGARTARVLRIGVAALALGWGVAQTVRGNAEAAATAARRGLPASATLHELADRVRAEVPAGEVVMSNLGPSLAWYADRPVIHLALTPADMAACRRRVEFRQVVLAFRDAGNAWPGWQEVMERPAAAPMRPEWNVLRERHAVTPDGFQVVWLELGPPETRVAGAVRRSDADARVR